MQTAYRNVSIQFNIYYRFRQKQLTQTGRKPKSTPVEQKFKNFLKSYTKIGVVCQIIVGGQLEHIITLNFKCYISKTNVITY